MAIIVAVMVVCFFFYIMFLASNYDEFDPRWGDPYQPMRIRQYPKAHPKFKVEIIEQDKY